ncbi:hypothetical protein DPMN_066557 [Dreissena polymorpha]|uniref:Uncharacterized protein n=1 Tax=Dreissena polymorpha TaxID=45954 RepID=A0A9D3YTQ5_DREPO|nr:hypothetical protein DPMN_066557 [Dreissena polymorpha]
MLWLLGGGEQYPLKPSFAITIHKSRGMTLEKNQQVTQEVFSVDEIQEICDKDDNDGPGLEELDNELNSLLLNLDDNEEKEVSHQRG